MASNIYGQIPRAGAALLDKVRGISVADLHDALDGEWRLRSLLGPAMRPLTTGLSFVGLAVTAYCPPGDNLMMHAGLFVTQPGDVLMVSNGGVVLGALWGENATIQAEKKPLAAVVVDGPIRDTDAIRARRFPVWSTSTSVSTPTKDRLGSVNTPISCAGVTVNPGDIVIGDGDGVLVLPPGIIAATAERARARAVKDGQLRAAIEAGGTLFETLRFDKALEELGGKIEARSWGQ